MRFSGAAPFLVSPGQQKTRRLWRVFHVVWLVRDSNPRRLSQLIYSQFPLATWVTSQMHFRSPVISRTEVRGKFSRIMGRLEIRIARKPALGLGL